MSQFLRRGRIPWSPGYGIYKQQLLTQVIADDPLLERFRAGEILPDGYGKGIDERCIEYPWCLANLSLEPQTMLDAGSTLNHNFILDHPVFRQKTIHILTLAPEASCFWERGISYLFADVRDIPVRDAYYDTIVCLSLLEHVGCDNTLYTRNGNDRENRPDDFLKVMCELRRVLKRDGTLLLTVPFGRYRNFRTFQQFDRRLLFLALGAFGQSSETNETFYRYTAEGWNLSTVDECADCEYVDSINAPDHEVPIPLRVEPDRAAAARAVACVRLVKK